MKLFKKIFMFLMVLTLAFTIVGCKKEKEEEKPIELELDSITDDSATVVEYTTDTETSISNATNTIATASGEEVSEEEKAEIVAQLTLTFKSAKFTDVQVQAICTLVVNNQALLTKLANLESQDITVDDLKALVALYKGIMAAAGDEFLGKVIYAQMVQEESTVTTYVNYLEVVKYGKLYNVYLNAFVNSLSDEDLTVIATVLNETNFFDEKPTYAQMEQLFDIIADGLKAVNISSASWTDVSELTADTVDGAIAVLLSTFTSNPTNSFNVYLTKYATDITEIRTKLKEVITGEGAYITASIGMLANVVDGLNATECSYLFADINSEFNPETYEYTITIDGKVVTEEESQVFEQKQQCIIQKLVINAYITIDAETRASEFTLLETLITRVDEFAAKFAADMEMTVPEYTGTTANYAELVAALQVVANVNVDSATFAADYATASSSLMDVLMNYLGTHANSVYYLASMLFLR